MIPNITLPPHTLARLRMQHYLSEFTRDAQDGQEKYWQKSLMEYDPELRLRWSRLNKQWLIIYDHHGQIDVITTFKSGESFGKAFKYVKYNSSLTSNKLRKLKQEQDETAQKEEDKKIDECGAEFGEELYHSVRERTITDGVENNKY